METMERIKSLNRYQKGILIFMIAMALVFAVVYPFTISKVGFEYKDTIFVPSYEKDSTVYSGKIHGRQAHFTVSEDKTIIFQYGDKTYILIQQKKTLPLFQKTQKCQKI